MTALEHYMDLLAMTKQNTLDKFEQRHNRAHGGDYGGQTEYYMATGKMVPPLIAVARAAFKLMGEGQNYHHDSEPYQAILRELHSALRDVEGV
jgi:hypothetical protein